MDNLIEYVVLKDEYLQISNQWKSFLDQHYKSELKIKIFFDSEIPTIIDSENRKLKIDFENDFKNYKKTKGGLNSEPLSRALGSGKKGLRVLDLSAGMAIDSIFLAQLGYQVTALERNPLLYLALEHALKNCHLNFTSNIEFIFSEASHFLLKNIGHDFDICYFDPMFPQKKKSALPKQEMILFKKLVGSDADSSDVIKKAIDSKFFKRCVVKRPLSALALWPTSGAIEGKLIRYDIYGN